MERTEKANGVVGDHGLFAKLQSNRGRFLALVEQLRPDLHRYCARMTGSIIDGEDFRYVPYIAREANIELIRQPEFTIRKETYDGA